MNKTVLLVEDDLQIRELLSEFLRVENFDVVSKSSSEEALDFMNSNKFDLVLSDINLPGMSGIQLFEKFKLTSHFEKKVPFVLMTGYADIISAQKAFQLGVDELISKPFNYEFVSSVLNTVLKSHGGTEKKAMRFVAMPIDDYIFVNTNKYNLYLRSKSEYLLISKAGQEFTTQRLSNLASKGVSHVYLEAASFNNLIDIKFELQEEEVSFKRPADEANFKLINEMILAFEKTQPCLRQVDERLLSKTFSNIAMFSDCFHRNPDILQLFDEHLIPNREMAELAFLRTILTLIVSQYWKWNSPKVKARLYLGSLLSGIGMSNEVQQLLNRPVAGLAKEEKIKVQEAFKVSRKLLLVIREFPAESLQVCEQFRENETSDGLPNSVSKTRLHSYSRFIYTIDEFCRLYLYSANKNVKWCLDKMSRRVPQDINLQTLKTLYLVFNLEMPTEIQYIQLPNVTNRLI